MRTTCISLLIATILLNVGTEVAGQTQIGNFTFDVNFNPIILNIPHYDTLYSVGLTMNRNVVDSISEIYVRVGETDSTAEIFEGSFNVISSTVSEASTAIGWTTSSYVLKLGRLLGYKFYYSVQIKKISGDSTPWITIYIP